MEKKTIGKETVWVFLIKVSEGRQDQPYLMVLCRDYIRER